MTQQEKPPGFTAPPPTNINQVLLWLVMVGIGLAITVVIVYLAFMH